MIAVMAPYTIAKGLSPTLVGTNMYTYLWPVGQISDQYRSAVTNGAYRIRACVEKVAGYSDESLCDASDANFNISLVANTSANQVQVY